MIDTQASRIVPSVQWLIKISEPGVRRRAEFYYQQLYLERSSEEKGLVGLQTPEEILDYLSHASSPRSRKNTTVQRGCSESNLLRVGLQAEGSFEVDAGSFSPFRATGHEVENRDVANFPLKIYFRKIEITSFLVCRK